MVYLQAPRSEMIKRKKSAEGSARSRVVIHLQHGVVAQVAHQPGDGDADSAHPSHGLHHGVFSFLKASLGGYHFGITAWSKWGSSLCHKRCSWCRAFPGSLKSKLISMHVPGPPPWWPNLGHGWKRKQIHICHENCRAIGIEKHSAGKSSFLLSQVSLPIVPHWFWKLVFLCPLSLCLSWMWHQRIKKLLWAPLKLCILWGVSWDLS